MSGSLLESAVEDRRTDAFSARRLFLAGFVLDLEAGELLTSEGRIAKLRKQALSVLRLLGARPGQVVGKDELMRAIWPNVVVGESSLAKAVSDIRHVLQDHDHHLLRNVTRRGYMLVPESAPHAPVSPSTLAKRVPSLSLVILPLQADLGPDEDWIADAINADLTDSMNRMSGSFVIGRGTAAIYKGSEIDPRSVSRELGVRYVVLGSARRNGDRLRLNLSMVDGESGVQLWSQHFEMERAELKRSIDDIVGQLARSLFIQLFHCVGDRAMRSKPERVTDDDLAMRGWSVYFRVPSRENFGESLSLFEKALAKNPNCLRALAGVSTASSFGVMLGYLPDKAGALRRAEETTVRLEQLGIEDWFALTARVVLAHAKNEWEKVLQVANTMVERFPNDPTAHQQRSAALLKLGNFEESIAAARRAIRFSPCDSRFGLLHLCLATNQFILGQYDEATANARRVQATNPNIPLATALISASLVRSGHKEQGQELLRNHLAMNPSFSASGICSLMPGSHPRFVEGRDRMIASLREIGLS